MRHPRFWSRRAQTLAGLAAIAVAVAFLVWRFVVDRQQLMNAAPIFAAVIALGSLIATASSLGANWRRQRREATLDAWTKWSESTTESRRTLSKHLGYKVLSVEQARALVYRTTLTNADGQPISPNERTEVMTALGLMLNGLERLAVGVELGVYDLTTIRRVGGTIVARSFDRAKPYIDLRRNADDEHRQEKVYVSLEHLRRELRHGTLLDQRRHLDEERLAYLRTNGR